MKKNKKMQLLVNLILVCVMLIHGIVSVITQTSTVGNSAPSWVGLIVCVPYICAIILFNVVFILVQKRGKR